MNKLFFVLLILLMLSSCSENPSVHTNDNDEIITPSITPLSSGVQSITGIVLGGEDQTPEGLLDSPREFIYQIQLDSGEEILLTYTAYPPSPVTDDQPGPQLNFHSGVINPGDSIKAQGTYDAKLRTLTVALETDFIETTVNP
jgi:hypothetical protein